MKKIWNFISYLGLDHEVHSLNEQVVLLSNRLNFLVSIFMISLFCIFRIENFFGYGSFGMGSVKVLMLLSLCIINLYLSYKNKSFAGRILIIFLGPLLLVVLPAMAGFVEEEDFVYNTYLLIAFSVLVPLLILPSENKKLFWSAFFYFLFLILVMDSIMNLFEPQHFAIIDRISTFQFMNKIAQIGIFLFINLSVVYLRNLNIQFEAELKQKNAKLDQQNEELKVTLEALKVNQQQLIQSDKMASLGTLTAGVAHEINNPLNFISGGLNILQDIKSHPVMEDNPDLKEEMLAASETIGAGLERSTRIVRSLMAFAYSGKSVKIASDVHEIIDNTLLFLQSKFEFKIEIRKIYSLEKKVPVFIDLLHQVVLNIIDNAVFELINNCHVERKVITISSSEKLINNVNYAEIIFSNNGPPIPKENLAHLFDPFFTTKKPGEGTGLGLSIVFNLVKKHNGTIVAQNTDGGVEFVLRLPLTDIMD